jgi:hypothetical protein
LRIFYRWSKPLRRFYREIGLPLDFDPVFERQHSPHRVLALFSSILARAQLAAQVAKGPDIVIWAHGQSHPRTRYQTGRAYRHDPFVDQAGV